ncbi:MAG: hypothetical protein GF346_09885, partial [Candidatus Eisenbacteria bacterium]|nr:hypothetical protein [Candidatus Latescibacterota bacterium]MBD3302744.1 hypothetical protein [Candidatus Eisenbacteria bacterium]
MQDPLLPGLRIRVRRPFGAGLRLRPAPAEAPGRKRREEGMSHQQRLEEGLELLYLMRERGGGDRAAFLAECRERDPAGLLDELTRRGAVESAEGPLRLTPEGLRRAAQVIRRHRLAEVLMHSVLMVEQREMEATACVFEHILSEDACDRVCAFLGHPTHCPHGGPIPPGRCCRLTLE